MVRRQRRRSKDLLSLESMICKPMSKSVNKDEPNKKKQSSLERTKLSDDIERLNILLTQD